MEMSEANISIGFDLINFRWQGILFPSEIAVDACGLGVVSLLRLFLRLIHHF